MEYKYFLLEYIYTIKQDPYSNEIIWLFYLVRGFRATIAYAEWSSAPGRTVPPVAE